MNKNDIEIRNIGTVERSAEDSRHVEGYAIVFDSRSEDLGFYEKIDRGAVTQELVNGCDIFALFNHDEDKVLARSNKGFGSLKLEVDDRGLHYSFDAPKTDLGDELLEHIRRNEVNTSSFAFYVNKNDAEAETWERKNGVTYRTIHKIAYIHDVSPVYLAAYSATSVSQRALDKVKELEEREQEEEKKKEAILSKLTDMYTDINDLTDKYTI